MTLRKLTRFGQVVLLFSALPAMGWAQQSASSDGGQASPSGTSAAVIPAPVGAHAESIATPDSCNHGAGESYTLAETVFQSIFGKNDPANFTPLCLSNLSEGWLQPWIPVGPGSSGALRGGWVGAPNGFFSREVDPNYSYTRGLHGAPDQNVGDVIIFTPLSRRLEIGISIPFVDELTSSNGHPSQTSFGDVTITPRIMLVENKDLGVTTGMSIRTPTGEVSTHNDETSLDPFVALWADLGNKWQVRAGTDVNVPTNRHEQPGLPEATLSFSLAFGKTITLNDGKVLSDVTPYLASNFHESFNSGNDDSSVLSFTPGVRFTLYPNAWFIAGVELPVTGPRPFGETYTFVLSLGF